jgi:hypothetical protein
MTGTQLGCSFCGGEAGKPPSRTGFGDHCRHARYPNKAPPPAVASETLILPLLNGMRHLDVLTARFGGDRVLGHVIVGALATEQMADAAFESHLIDQIYK